MVFFLLNILFLSLQTLLLLFQEPILDFYKDVLFNRINPKLDTLFKNVPDVPIE